MRGEEDLIVDYSERRRNYYKRLKTFSTFGRGWLRRVEETELEALKIAGVYLQN
jgi:lysozyme family protein